MKYFLIAGEASGDIHAAELIKQLKHYDNDAKFTFLGGDLMRDAAGCEPLIHYREMAYMGFSEVLRNLGKVRRNLKTAKRAVAAENPDCLILIDYPSFNLKVAKEAKKHGIKVFYYISPKVWAWKEWRVKTIKRLVDKMFVIFPFEVDFYRNRHNYDVQYVGNPSVEEIDNAIAAMGSRTDFIQRNSLRDRPMIAILPGSRRGEIRNNLPIMVAAAMQFPQYRGVVAAAPGIDTSFYKQYTDLPLVSGQTFELLRHSAGAIVTSGTATLETALIGTPQVACYRANGSKVAYNIMKRLLSVDFVTLPNLIANREIIGEMLLHMCTADAVAQRLAPLLRNGAARDAMLDDYAEMRRALGTNNAAEATARGIITALKQ
jgi:lipid-A-disaccharide synthase